MQSQYKVETVKWIFDKNAPNSEIQKAVFKALLERDAFVAKYNGKEIEVVFKYLKDNRVQAKFDEKTFWMKVILDPTMPTWEFKLKTP